MSPGTIMILLIFAVVVATAIIEWVLELFDVEI